VLTLRVNSVAGVTATGHHPKPRPIAPSGSKASGYARRFRFSTSGVAVVPEIAIWRAANLLIQQHGENAELEAAKRADLIL